MYLFLVERVYIIRYKRYLRRTNRWYIINLAIIVLEFDVTTPTYQVIAASGKEVVQG
jgi:hypothetical protein